MSVATAYEKERGAYVQDVSAGNDPRLREALERCGCARPSVASADIVSSLDHEIRIIEVKGRGSSGPITVIEREHETFSAAGPASWLYVVWNTTQPGPYRLITVQDPQHLPWVQTQPAEREPGMPRGSRHEAKFECQPQHIQHLGVEADLTGLTLPSKTTTR